jgi:hypothetical protein
MRLCLSSWVSTLFTPARGAFLHGLGPALLFCLAAQPLAAAEPSFPRGPGFYYHPVKLVLLLVLYLCWAAACGWVDGDVRKLGIDSCVPSALMIAAGLFSLVIVWLLPWFWLGYLLFLFVVVGTTLLYARYRDHKVGFADRVLTEKHLKGLLSRYFGVRQPDPEEQRRAFPCAS